MEKVGVVKEDEEAAPILWDSAKEAAPILLDSAKEAEVMKASPADDGDQASTAANRLLWRRRLDDDDDGGGPLPPHKILSMELINKKWVIVSASTASFFLLLLFMVTYVYSEGNNIIDLSGFRSISSEKTFKTVNIRPADYPHIDEHPFNCTSSSSSPNYMNLTCPANYQQPPPEPGSSPSPNPTCPEYFRWIHEDLKPWKKHGITREMVEVIEKNRPLRHFRLVIVNGTAYVKRYDRAFQTRDVFTLWGILQLLKMYPGQVPDLDLMFQCHDQPSIKKKTHYHYDNSNSNSPSPPPPLFHYCGSDDTYDIVFPDWSFWGWPEINIKPWVPLKKELAEGNKMVNWTDRKPYSYWRGNLYTGSRRRLGSCNSTKRWNTVVYQQDWAKEVREGFKNSDMSKQCTHRYKIYMEGNAWSVSEKYILACDSMALLVNPVYYDFFTRSLVPLKHYWPINPRDMCNSLKFAVDWGNHHPRQAQEIGKAGSRFVQEEILMQHVYDYMFHVLSEYGKLMAYRPTIPPGAVELCSETWVCSANDLENKYKLDTLVNVKPASAAAANKLQPPCSFPPPFKQRELSAIRGEKAKNIEKVETWRRKGKID